MAMGMTRKQASFLRGALGMAKKFAPAASGPAGGRLYSKHLGGNIATQGVMKTVKDYAKGGAGFGAVIGGGMGAYQAEEGHRLEGAVKGAIPMALQGAVGGAMSGAVTQPLRNLRQHAMAGRYGKDVAKTTLNASWRDNLKGMATGKNGPRGAHAMEALAAPATIAADVYVGDKLMGMMPGGGHEEQPAPQQVPQAQQWQPGQHVGPYRPYMDHVRVASALALDEPLVEEPAVEALGAAKPKHIEPFLVTPFTGMTGKIVSDAAVKRFHPNMVEGTLRKHVLPTAAAAALTIPAITAIRAYNASQAPAAPNPLDELDVDALKYYFGKQPATQGDHHADRNH